jgi:RNA 3'-phosphate cyclase
MLRTAVVWSLLTRTPFRMVRIRENRRDPGLKAQHLHVLRAVAALGPVGVEGDRLGSKELRFRPAPLRGAQATVDVGTAGSLTLILQTLLPAILLAQGDSRIRLVGGTDVAWSPPIDWFVDVALGPALRRAVRLRLDVRRRGFYPAGGGEIELEGGGWREDVGPLNGAARGPLKSIRIRSFASESLSSRRVAERQAEAAAAALAGQGVVPETTVSYGETRSPGSVLSCVAESADGWKLGASALGERGRPAEEVGAQAAAGLAKELASGACVDEHAADQILPWLALCGGVVEASEVSAHARSNMEVIERFGGKLFRVEGRRVVCPEPFHPAGFHDVRME